MPTRAKTARAAKSLTLRALTELTKKIDFSLVRTRLADAGFARA